MLLPIRAIKEDGGKVDSVGRVYIEYWSMNRQNKQRNLQHEKDFKKYTDTVAGLPALEELNF